MRFSPKDCHAFHPALDLLRLTAKLLILQQERISERLIILVQKRADWANHVFEKTHGKGF